VYMRVLPGTAGLIPSCLRQARGPTSR
jgi:hypothetical protein